MSVPATHLQPNQPGAKTQRQTGNLLSYSLKKVGQSLITVIIVITLVFLLMRMMPLEGYIGDGYDKLDPEQREAILRNMGLLDPWYTQLKNFYVELAHGNLGTSITFRRNIPVTEILGPKIPYSFKDRKSVV